MSEQPTPRPRPREDKYLHAFRDFRFAMLIVAIVLGVFAIIIVVAAKFLS